MSLGFKGLMNHKMVLFLLFVVVVNLVVSALVWRLDFFVHGDLYAYGLVYSLDWADPYWYSTAMLWAFLGGATAFAAASIVPHYLHSREISRFSTWTGFFLPIFALIYQGISIFYFDQKNSIVWNTLHNYGVRYDAEWATTYNLISVPAVALMAIALFALIVPAVMAVSSTPGVVRFNNPRRDKALVTLQNRGKEAETQETVQPLEREEVEPKSPIGLLSTKRADSLGKLASEEKLDRVRAEDSTVQKTAKKRKKRSRKKKISD